MNFKKCTSKVKGYYYYCTNCNKQIDYYEYLNYIECERCLSHEQVEDTLIFQTIDDKWFLRIGV